MVMQIQEGTGAKGILRLFPSFYDYQERKTKVSIAGGEGDFGCLSSDHF